MSNGFIDEATVIVASGSGGNGCVSFYRGPHIPRGGPDGGNGGSGGNVFVLANENINTLQTFYKRRKFFADNGKAGSGRNCNGAYGNDVVLYLPVGTQVFDDDSSLLLVDLKFAGQKELLLSGGNGGAGNRCFKSSTNRAPLSAKKGELGKELKIRLKLKLLSDVGIVGLPNVGKSTLLSVCSASPTRVAPYAFTTLEPKLGVVFLSDYEDFVMADLPGLIKGSSTGLGHGIQFLRHIERCSVLLHLIDATSSSPVKDYQNTRAELLAYNKTLSCKHEIVAISKIDEVQKDEYLQKIQSELAEAAGKKIYVFSSLFEDSVYDLMHVVYYQILSARNNAKYSKLLI
ncbi:GTPase Obg [Candidatus Xenohaliotis californiensis]|uniref:GTPase Obg n=1 Tax=Candidatus Xenohaliotis californiensis TaxID=84677 RepID=A0ABM9N7R7_9RICK|nr:GTPase Obg [Candidatus Xenohaliotis californiensis]